MDEDDYAEQNWHVAEVRAVPHSEIHPEGVPSVFIQWKGTAACLDFHCTCGGGGHFDGMFAYELECNRCGAVYAMPDTVYPLRLDPRIAWNSAKVPG